MNEAIIKHALDAIAALDPDVAKALPLTGYPVPRIRPAGFEALFSIVVSQQLSTHAARAIMDRANALLPNINAESVLASSTQALRKLGLSRQKISYLHGLSKATLNGEFNPEALAAMDDQTAIDNIVALKGFGPWSAEIYLMFSLQREDIFPAGDLALLLALQRLKNLSEKPSPKQARELTIRWSPWRSVGSLFLWQYYHVSKPKKGRVK